MLSTLSHHAVTPVPTGLMTAAVDFLNVVRPASSTVEFDIVALARRLRFDATTALALAARVRATANMFADDRWVSVRRLRFMVCADDALTFEIVVMEFMAVAPLDAALTFDVDALLRKLLAALPSHGCC